MSTNKQKYTEICENHSIPIFSQPWWLDVVAGPEHWDVVVSEEGGNFLAALPYTHKTLGPWKIAKMPELTPALHIWFNYPNNAKYTTCLAFEKEYLSQLIANLPAFSRFHQKYTHALQNWLPFYWRGYKQTTRYTYMLTELDDLQQVQQNFKKNNRYDIRKAEKIVQVEELMNIEDFIHINKKSFQRQGEKASYAPQLVRRIDNACSQQNCRKILAARDAQGNIHAAVYLIWDDHTVYYLLGGGDPEFRNSNANSLLVWHAIQLAAKMQKKFDFEGSMMEPIERFFRSFGAEQVPYFSIYKNRFPFQLLELK